MAEPTTPKPNGAAPADPPAAPPAAGGGDGLLTGDGDAAPALLSGATDPAAPPVVPPDPAAPPADPAAPADPNAPPEQPDEVPAGAPDEYTDFTAPEGITLDAETTTSFKAVAKELNLPQAKAQQVVDLGTALVQRAIDTLVEGFTQTRTQWTEASRAEFDGPALAKAKHGLETFGTPALTQFLREERLENHPEIIRLLARVGELASEDGFVPGGAVPRGGATLADRMFPASNR